LHFDSIQNGRSSGHPLRGHVPASFNVLNCLLTNGSFCRHSHISIVSVGNRFRMGEFQHVHFRTDPHVAS
jgi:hypothetical protein